MLLLMQSANNACCSCWHECVAAAQREMDRRERLQRPLIRVQSRMTTNTGLKYSLGGREPEPKARLEEPKCRSSFPLWGNASTDFCVRITAASIIKQAVGPSYLKRRPLCSPLLDHLLIA
jgi:hypothetical protein